MSQFRVRTLLALPLLVASLFAAAQAIRQHGVKFADGKTAIAFDALVVGAMALAFLAAAVWSTLDRRVLLLRTTVAGVACFSLTLAWLHAFPHLFDPRNLLLRAIIIFLLLFMPSLAIAWTVKIAVSLIRWARYRRQDVPKNPRQGGV